jgi:hypothetical protein
MVLVVGLIDFWLLENIADEVELPNCDTYSKLLCGSLCAEFFWP